MRRITRVSSQAEAWQKMLASLQEFKSEHGSCEVPAAYRSDPRLGRWVAAQRHKHKCGVLSPDRTKMLEGLGFNWAPGGNAWGKMFKKLCEFKAKHGHCDVPQNDNSYRDISAWVQHQRTRYRKDILEAERIEQLEQLGFCWCVGRGNGKSTTRQAESQDLPCLIEASEKLYAFGHGVYVQHDGNGQKIEALERYQKKHRGQYPPFIPLPLRPVVFNLGLREFQPIEVRWQGCGPLPESILAYVSNNGTLPPYR